jgi:hypothetical protein
MRRRTGQRRYPRRRQTIGIRRLHRTQLPSVGEAGRWTAEVVDLLRSTGLVKLPLPSVGEAGNEILAILRATGLPLPENHWEGTTARDRRRERRQRVGEEQARQSP